jgi:hypothetical protein
MTVQVTPGVGAPTTVTVPGGRTYTCAIGSTIQVPDSDALILLANSWLRSANATGTTAARPTAVAGGAIPLNYEYYDTTLSVNVMWNGKNWVKHTDGSIA